MRVRGQHAGSLADWLAHQFGPADLAPLPADDAVELAASLTVTSVPVGTVVHQRDDFPCRVHIIRAGEVELTRELGGRRIIVQRLGPGSVFGDLPVFLRRGEPVTARVVADATLASIDSVVLFELLGRRPRLARRWLASVAERTASMQDRITDLLAGPLDVQVASWLLREAVNGRASVSQHTLGRLLGARRTSVNQVLRRLETAGYVELGYRWVRVADENGLRSFAGIDRPAVGAAQGAAV